MALTQSDWKIQPSPGNGRFAIFKSTVAFTTAENDAYTKPTPTGVFDPTKPWTLVMKFGATPDGQAVPVDLWIGYSTSFLLAGNDTTVAATDGMKFKQVLDDAVLAVDPLVYMIHFDPYLPVADVVTVAAIGTGLKVRIPIAPYYAININGGSTLNATTATFYIIQKQ